ncbi:uncharacterized protein LOC135839635 [Planococcus citri]|uniref:uncharacterized protein LOC135839635 n=1 Tax=Planococcus citri TaxID=170843 RepID=UPI0031F8300F
MKNKSVEFNVEVNDIITPSSCSSMVIEFIKYIIYQKQLIPYNYERLKMYVPRGQTLVDSMKDSDQGDRSFRSKHFVVLDKYLHKTRDAYNSLEKIFHLINEELTSTGSDRVEEIVIMLGTSFLNPQEVFRIRIPSLNYSHLDKHHSTRKNCRNLFRSMINSEQFYDLISSNCTGNLHVMLKMKPDHSLNSNSFILRNGFRLPTKGKQAVITFQETHHNPQSCSCFEIKIYEDDSTSDSLPLSQSSDCSTTTDVSSCCSDTNSSSNPNGSWYQVKDTLRYFSDVKIDGTSVTDIWMNPTLLNSGK